MSATSPKGARILSRTGIITQCVVKLGLPLNHAGFALAIYSLKANSVKIAVEMVGEKQKLDT